MPSSGQLERVYAFIKQLVKTDRIVGALLHIERRHVERRGIWQPVTVWQQAFGWADRESRRPVAPDTIFRVRSMTKPLVGTVALMLMEEGRLTLEDRICRYLPAFDRPAMRDITVLHLLTHTSGLVQPVYDNTTGTAHTSLREAVDHLGREGTLAFAPGSAYEYSDPGSSALGALVAEVTGLPCEELINRRILQPLGMADSFCTVVDQADPRRARIASTYRGEEGSWHKYWDPAQPQLVPFFRASGGLYATAADYARFMAAFLCGGSAGSVRLLSPETVRAALTPRAWRQPVGAGLNDPSEAYGLHWTLYGGFYGAVGQGTFGHGGSDGTIALADPTRNLVVLYMTQSRGNTTRPEVMRRLFAELA